MFYPSKHLTHPFSLFPPGLRLQPPNYLAAAQQADVQRVIETEGHNTPPATRTYTVRRVKLVDSLPLFDPKEKGTFILDNINDKYPSPIVRYWDYFSYWEYLIFQGFWIFRNPLLQITSFL